MRKPNRARMPRRPARRGSRQGRALRRIPLIGRLTELPELRHLEAITLDTVWGERFHSPKLNELIYVLDGRARIDLGSRSFDVGPGDVFVIPRGVRHRDVRSSEHRYRVLYAFFAWPDGESLLARLDARALLRAPDRERAHLHMMLRELEDAYLGEVDQAGERVELILLEILLALSRYSSHAAPPMARARQRVARESRRQLVAAARAYMETHYAEELSLERLASAHAASPFNLSRNFSRECGMSITDTLAMIRIDRAKELLRGAGPSVKQVAARVGYADGNYFAKVFRRVVGCSPSQYRAKALELH